MESFQIHLTYQFSNTPFRNYLQYSSNPKVFKPQSKYFYLDNSFRKLQSLSIFFTFLFHVYLLFPQELQIDDRQMNEHTYECRARVIEKISALKKELNKK
ncbi:hypothetical protein ABPG74_022246 [Tetrahymena malaccensis]